MLLFSIARTNALFAGDNQDLVLHIYAAGSQIDATINKQTSTEIAATSEDEIDDAEVDDPVYNGSDDGSDDDGIDDDGSDDDGSDDDGSDDNGDSGIAVGGSGTGNTAVSHSSQSSPATTFHATASATASASAAVVKVAGTFNYLGCQLDSSTARTLSSLSWTGTGLTVERCAAYCNEYQYMGVEFGSQ